MTLWWNFFVFYTWLVSQGSWVRDPVWQHTFVFPSAFSRRAVVNYWRKYVHKVLVKRLGGLSLPRKSVVRLTDRPDMTLDVYRGRKTTNQQQQHLFSTQIWVNVGTPQALLLMPSGLVHLSVKGCLVYFICIIVFSALLRSKGMLMLYPGVRICIGVCVSACSVFLCLGPFLSNCKG